MSQSLTDAAAALVPKDADDPHNPHFNALQLGLVRQAVERLGHGTMIYACVGNPRKQQVPCGFEWRVWLSMGVGGPPDFRDAGLYVPCAFHAGRCPNWECGGGMRHERWNEDEHFDYPRLIPDDAPRFTLPPFLDTGGADLVIPADAWVRARQYVHEEMGIGFPIS